MAKKSSAAAAKAAKKAKAVEKVERKETKKVLKTKGTASSTSATKGKSKAKKANDSDTDDDDLEGILERMRKEWEVAHTVTEELVEGPPSRRANATLTACPNGNHLWCIGGEFFSEDGRAYFYNDVFRYTPEKDEWRKFVSPTCPGPRSAHAVVASPGGGGKLFLFGGEFSSLHQNTFHHYRDFWCFDIATHSWDRIDTKIRPSARSGHRMAVWKHLIILLVDFMTLGSPLSKRSMDFDTQEYTWTQVEFKATENRPRKYTLGYIRQFDQLAGIFCSPRSGFSFLPCADGIILHGIHEGKRPVGVMLEDTWLLKHPNRALPPRPLPLNHQPNPSHRLPRHLLRYSSGRNVRGLLSICAMPSSGCTMTLWPSKGMGILFGGVTDEDTSEEQLESLFWNDLYGYQLTGKGKWTSMTLKKPKAKVGKKSEKKKQQQQKELSRSGYGGIYERGSREYTLDDFYSLPLDKMDRYTCLRRAISDEDGEDDSNEDEEEASDADDESDGAETLVDEDVRELEKGAAIYDTINALKKAILEEEEEAELDDVSLVPDINTEEEQNDLRQQANAFMGVAKDTTRSAEDVQSTPLPGETLAMFYARSREYWTQKAHGSSDNKGKQLRRDGFALAEERYEVEKILEEAGLDEEEMRRGAAGGPAASGATGESRNRR
ncbi:hypothetical protein BJ912DRAFT_1025273 [Pholiota molesta]|nr:hypothetical protein BJ912DRAFT_1025273 [Pholiota molesta]